MAVRRNERKGIEPEINLNVVPGKDNKAVQSAINLMQENQSVKIEREDKNILIQQLFENGFNVHQPRGPRYISAKLLQQAVFKMATRMKMLDFTLHGTGRPEHIELAVTKGLSSMMNRGELNRALRDKNGVFHQILAYGNSFLHIGANPEEGNALKFNNTSSTNIYVDSYATIMRGSYGRRVTEMVIIYSMSWAEAIKLYPEYAKKGGAGRIPRDLSFFKDIERDYTQTEELYDDYVEFAHYININEGNYTIFGGSGCTVVEELDGEDFPFVFPDGERYIPVTGFMCFPALEGFYDHGIGDYVYDLALITQRLMNMEVGHALYNAFPIDLINVPKGEAGKFFNKLQLAEELRAQGRRGYVAMEYDPNQPNAQRVDAQTLTTQALVDEAELIFSKIDQELKRMGINLDEIDRGADVTATQILAEEEASNSTIRQVMEYNASETETMVKIIMDMIRKNVPDDDDTVIDFEARIPFEGEQIQPEGMTLGMVAKELRENNYFVRVNSRTGVIPSNTFKQAQINQILPSLPPGSPAQTKALHQLALLNDQEYSIEDFGGQPQQAEEVPQGVSGTDRTRINSRSSIKEPAL